MKIDWHARYSQQAQWTKSLREYLLSNLVLGPQSRILEVGCGTGAILVDYHLTHPGQLYGIDIDFSSCVISTRNSTDSFICTGDVFNLPYPSGSFDLIFCHYFLLWLLAPLHALSEVKRVLKPGASFLIFAEPDYSGRIDYPPPLTSLGELQSASLTQQGANPSIGRQLPSLLSASGFEHIQYGVSGFEAAANRLPDWWNSEWQVLKHDLKNLIDPAELDELQALDERCWWDGSRILWVPTFYLSCRNPCD